MKLAAAGVAGSTWRVLDDLRSSTSAKVLVNGHLSEPWTESAGVRQGSVLGPLLFNILFDGISEAVRAACPGVALGRDIRAPRITVLLYADDLVVLAENQRDLQRALDAIGAWGARSRFSFGIGPETTAVLVVGSRSRDFWFLLHGLDVPVVAEYCYLGVVFQASRKWSKHTDRFVGTGNRKFHQSIAWAENRRLHTGFSRSLFRAYVLPSLLHGAAFLEDASLRRLDKQMRQWGRRLLFWPAGAPGAAVLGELGWAPFAMEVSKTQANLLGRLSSADPDGIHRSLAARVFRYALRMPGSWAHDTSNKLRSAGVTLPDAFGVVPGCAPRVIERWTHRRVRPALDACSFRMRQAEVNQLQSLEIFVECHPT